MQPWEISDYEQEQVVKISPSEIFGCNTANNVQRPEMTIIPANGDSHHGRIDKLGGGVRDEEGGVTNCCIASWCRLIGA